MQRMYLRNGDLYTVTDDPPGPALNPKPAIQRANEPEAKPKKKSSSPGQ